MSETKTNSKRFDVFKVRLPPEVNRILYVRNLPYKITSDEMYDIFGKYGAIRQIRVGNTLETRGKKKNATSPHIDSLFSS